MLEIFCSSLKKLMKIFSQFTIIKFIVTAFMTCHTSDLQIFYYHAMVEIIQWNNYVVKNTRRLVLHRLNIFILEKQAVTSWLCELYLLLWLTSKWQNVTKKKMYVAVIMQLMYVVNSLECSRHVSEEHYDGFWLFTSLLFTDLQYFSC